MGGGQSGGLSGAESAEIAASYAYFSSLDDPPRADEPTFKGILAARAPSLYAKAEKAGHADAAARTLRDQFDRKYAVGIAAADGAAAAAAAAGDAAAADGDPAVDDNVCRGLQAGLMAAYPLRSVRVRLSRHELTAALSTGLERSVVTAAAARECDLERLVDRSFPVGRIHHVAASFEAPGPACEAAFDVVETLPPPLDGFAAVLGNDFFVRNEAVLDFKNSVLRLTPPSGASNATPRTVDVALLYDKAREEKEVLEAKTAANLTEVASAA